jgi:hypothetical protein
VTQDRVQWPAFVNMVMKLRDVQKSGIFLTYINFNEHCSMQFVGATSSLRSCNLLKATFRIYTRNKNPCHYVGVLISLWLFLLAAQPTDFFLDWIKKL